MNEKDLHPYQLHCIDHIINNARCGLFLDMGLGKTVTALTAFQLLKYDYVEVSKALVVAPKRIVDSVWDVEAEKWEHLKDLTFVKIVGTAKQRRAALMKKADIYLISRDNIAWLCDLLAGEFPFDMLIIDELSSFKSHKTQRFKSLKSYARSAQRFVGLTGTPAPNSLIDLWPQIYFMDFGKRLGYTISAYRERFFSPDKSQGHIVYSYSLNPGAADMIQASISDICISLSAEDYLQMPDLIENDIKLSLTPELKEKYKEFEKEKIFEIFDNFKIDDDALEIPAVSATALSNKLLQFANGAMYTPDKEIIDIHNIKLEALESIMEEANGEPVMVAWSYRFDCDRILEHFKAYEPRCLNNQKDIDDWNAGKIKMLLLHPASGGHGLNLQAGGHIIVWYGLTWSLELYQQLNARLYRQGQDKPVIVHRLIMKGTHDVDVARAIAEKTTGQKALLDSLKAKIEYYLKNR